MPGFPFATAFAAGAVDIIGYTRLGGVFASAMTGNFALLAYHLAWGNSVSAIGSVIALAGFISGCFIGFMLRRGRSERGTISLLLSAETGLLLLLALYSLCNIQATFIPARVAQIVILAVAMGLQAVRGIGGAVLLPLGGVAVALAAHCLVRGGFPGATNQNA